MKRLSTIALFFLIASATVAQNTDAYLKGYYKDGGKLMPYRFLSPPVAGGKQYPLIIFLHGALEKGTDNTAQLNIGGRFFLRDSIRKNYPAYILFPQCPEDDSWAYFENRLDLSTGLYTDWDFRFQKRPTPITGTLINLIDSVITNNEIDKSRVYIAGVSQGGMGVLDMITRKPETFAAALAICGAGDPSTARLFAGKVAVWLFHGSRDKIVPPDFSKQFYRKLNRANSNIRFSEYKEVGHDSWIKAFAEPDLMKWLFSQSKNQSLE